MTVALSVFEVLEGLVRLELSLDLASSLLLKNCSIKGCLWLTYVTFIAIEDKAIFAVLLSLVVESFHHVPLVLC